MSSKLTNLNFHVFNKIQLYYFNIKKTFQQILMKINNVHEKNFSTVIKSINLQSILSIYDFKTKVYKEQII